MTTDTATATQRGRLVGVDAARGLALIGMMAVHIIPGETAAGTARWTELAFGGRASALFAVLAGVSLGLAYGRGGRLRGERLRRATAALWVRAGLIGLVGLLIGYADSGVAVILAYYAVLFVLAAPLLGASTRVVAAVTGLCFTVVPVLLWLAQPRLPARDPQNPDLDWLGRPVALLRELTLTGYYPALAWIGYLALGLLVVRLGLRGGRAAGAIAVAGASMLLIGSGLSRLLLTAGGDAAIVRAEPEIGTSAELADRIRLGGFGHAPQSTPWWLVTDGPHTTTPFDLLVTAGSALLVLGLLLLAAPRLGRLAAPLAAAGAMTLTLYSVHVLVLSTTWTDALSPVVSWLVQSAAVLVIGAVWRARVGRGPLEGAMRTASSGAARAVA